MVKNKLTGVINCLLVDLLLVAYAGITHKSIEQYFTQPIIIINQFSLTLFHFVQGQSVSWRWTFSTAERKSWACWTKWTNGNTAFLFRIVFCKNMAANSEVSVNEVNSMTWSLKMEVHFTKQVRMQRIFMEYKI